MLGEEDTFGINGSFGAPEKKFSKANTNFCLSLRYNADNSYLFVIGKEIFEFQTENENVKSPTRFCLGSIFDGFINIESREVPLNKNVYYFSVDYNSIDKSDILNIINI